MKPTRTHQLETIRYQRNAECITWCSSHSSCGNTTFANGLSSGLGRWSCLPKVVLQEHTLTSSLPKEPVHQHSDASDKHSGIVGVGSVVVVPLPDVRTAVGVAVRAGTKVGRLVGCGVLGDLLGLDVGTLRPMLTKQACWISMATFLRKSLRSSLVEGSVHLS